MKVLLHICCAPCAVYTLDALLREGFDVMGFFYRNNIHPFAECLRRQKALEEFSKIKGLKVIYPDEYDIVSFLQKMAFRESARCRICYHARLLAAAGVAKKGKFDAFTTTLLYSKYQNHQTIRETGEAVSRTKGVPFLYRDFRSGWKEGIERSREMGLYRQQYCGCIYSEAERFYTPSKKPK